MILGSKMMAVVAKHFEIVLDESDPSSPVYWRNEQISPLK
jgi:hypothetical protein